MFSTHQQPHFRGSSGETQLIGSSGEPQSRKSQTSITRPMDNMDSILVHLLDPISGSPTYHKEVLGLVVLHVDDLFLAGSPEFERQVVNRIMKDYKIGS